MPTLAPKDKCTGCAACYNSCEYQAIEMNPGILGFQYPVVDLGRCVECGKCEGNCPILHMPNMSSPICSYAARLRSEEILLKSSSGGMFYAFASYVIQNDGVVYGAIVDSDFTVKHIGVESFERLYEVMGSKYVQSAIGDVYSIIKKNLMDNRWVLFSGTPCQVYGLKAYLHKFYEKLITMDFFYHSVPSPLLFKKYIDYQNNRLGKIKSIAFRDKSRGYDYPTIKINYLNKSGMTEEYCEGSEYDSWLRCFLSNNANRSSCNDCVLQRNGSKSDFTMGDLNNVDELAQMFNDNKGCSKLTVNSPKGVELLRTIEQLELINFKKINLIEISKRKKISKDINLKEFTEDAHTLSPKDFFCKYYAIDSVVILKRLLRLTMYNLHIHSVAKKFERRIKKIIELIKISAT